MRDYSSKEWKNSESIGFFDGVKTIVYSWLIIAAVVGLFYLSFTSHWG